MELLGLIGFLVILAGIHLLWQAREDCLFWFEEFLRIFRSSLPRASRSETAHAHLLKTLRHPSRQSAGTRPKTLRMVGGFGLILLGQLLVILNFALT